MARKAFLLLLLFTLLFSFECRHKTDAPNILLITIDTLRADHLGCYGYSRKLTPTLDQLAQNGILFENAFCVIPTTVPSHGTIFFGTWPRIHGSLNNGYLYTNKNLAFLPDLLKKAGYTTGAIMSGSHLISAMERVPGFETLLFAGSEAKAEQTLKKAVKWFDKKPRKPFFFWIHLWDPHWPYDLHPEMMSKINKDFVYAIPQHHSFFSREPYTAEGSQKTIDLYDNEIAYADNQLGLFFAELKKEHKLDNTMILIMSDHGESMAELLPKYNYAFDHGEFLFDSQLHVPLIVVLPDGKYAGSRVSQVVTLLDVMPSVLQYTGLPIPKTVAGKSFLNLFQSKSPGVEAGPIFVERRFFGKQFQTASQGEELFGIREADAKLTYNIRTGAIDVYKNSNEWQAFELDSTAKDRMLAKLQDWIKRTNPSVPKNLEKVSDEEIQKLKALGYVQ